MTCKKRARHFAYLLCVNWFLNTLNLKFLEVPLFNALARTILGLSNNFAIAVLHGVRSTVTYSCSFPWRKAKARCELCDLMFITYGRIPSPWVRLSFLQAKASKSKNNMSRFPRYTIPTAFRANSEQQYLLGVRPQIAGTKRFSPPTNLLSSSLLSSVGTFGVFYNNGTGTPDLFYSIADRLHPKSGSYTKKYQTFVTSNGNVTQRSCGHIEMNHCHNLYLFGYGLYRGWIGTPVHPTNFTSDADKTRCRDLWTWLHSVIDSNRVHFEGTNLIDDLLGLVGMPPTDEREESISPAEPSPTIIIVNVDE